MASFKTIIEKLELCTEQHLQLNDFDWGNPDNITTKDHTFPMLFAAPVPGNINGSLVTLRFDLYILDLEAQDFSNLLTIMNETLFIGNDIITEFFEEQDGELFNFSAENVSVTPFEAKFDDHTAGWIFNVEITLTANSCYDEIPKITGTP